MPKRQPDQAGNEPDQIRGPEERRIHGGIPEKPDDQTPAKRTEQELVRPGVDDYDPEDVPPATES